MIPIPSPNIFISKLLSIFPHHQKEEPKIDPFRVQFSKRAFKPLKAVHQPAIKPVTNSFKNLIVRGGSKIKQTGGGAKTAFVRYFCRKCAPNVRKINPKVTPQEAASIAQGLYQVIKQHGPLTVSNTWNHAKWIKEDSLEESADNVSPDSSSPSKDDLLEEACKKYDEATHLCPTLHDAYYNWAIAISDQAKIRGRTKEAEELWKQLWTIFEKPKGWEAGSSGLSSKTHMKTMLKWMRGRKMLKLFCNHVGSSKKFLHCTQPEEPQTDQSNNSTELKLQTEKPSTRRKKKTL
ncbi:unnamed protein product [Camellia sinensis]